MPNPFHIIPEPSGHVTPRDDVTIVPAVAAQNDVNPAGDLVVTVDKNAPLPPENQTPKNRAIWHIGAYPPLQRWTRRIRNFYFDTIRAVKRAWHWLAVRVPVGPKTPEELREIQEMRDRRAMRSLLESESKIAGPRIINCLTRLNICYRYPKTERDTMISGVQEVHILKCSLSENALYFHIDTDHLPRGIYTTQLSEEKVLKELSLACNKTVSADYDPDHGLILIMSRSGNANGIPEHVNYTDMLNDIPSNLDLLTVPIGVGQNGRRVYVSFGKIAHMLVAGTTGSGKSTFLHSIFLTLIQRVPPNKIKFILVDLKGGIEFYEYEGLPHLLRIDDVAPTGIIEKRDGVLPVIEYLIKEGEDRMAMIKATKGARNIGELNAHRSKNYLPHIFLIIDEWADIKLDKTLADEVEDKLVNVVARMRASGIHVVLCTQYPKIEVVNNRVKTMMDTRIVFNCPQGTMSQAILDNYEAFNLHPVGRAIFRHNGASQQLQTPLVTGEHISQVVSAVRTGGQALIARKHDVTIQEVVEWGLENEKGSLSPERLWQTYKERGITRDELRAMLDDIEGKDITIGMVPYMVKRFPNPRGLRVVAKDKGNEPANNPDKS